ncbi:MAG: hypothetical protein LUI60_06295 [Clostridia bacterium]|nr:hypothetical protein [Clostridia bacterium]
MKSKSRVVRVFYIVLVLAMLFLFFTNDFGLVDIHKSSIVMAVGVDVSESGYSVTAQAAVPTPSQGEGSTAYTQVTGEGATVAEALNDINVQTGFYPKLIFCNLVILGESCKEQDIFTVLDYFYRNRYVPLTALVCMCGGDAKELLGQKPADGDMSSMAIQRAMSSELKKSANVASVNLKQIAQYGGSKSASTFMPFVTCVQSGSGGTTAAAASDSSGGSSQGGGEEASAQFTCAMTAVFSEGKFAGILDEEQTFALDILRGGIRLAVVNAAYDGVNYTVGLKNNRSLYKVKIKDGAVLKIKYRARANVQASENNPALQSNADTHIIKEGVLSAVEEEIKNRITSLIEYSIQSGRDFLGIKHLLYAYNKKHYAEYNQDILGAINVDFDIKIKSAR